MSTTNESTDLDLIELASRANDVRVRDFTEILDKIDTLDDKKRQLWKEIYENCISDRQNSYALFIKLAGICQAKSTEWAIHGRTIVQLQERMGRTVDQMLKLADLIHKAERANDAIDPEDIYSAIGS
jgi:hypothetical protein